MTRLFLRAPVFPLLLESDHQVFAILEASELSEIVAAAEFSKKSSYDAVDTNAEGWSYVPKVDALSPLTVNKRWSKKKIIEFYNSHSVTKGEFETRNLSNLRVRDLVVIIASHARGV